MKAMALFPFAAGASLMLLTASVDAATPSIAYQPTSRVVLLYQEATLGVIASGTPPLAYQWRKDGAPIVGATRDQLVFTQSKFPDAGRYSVVVSNAEGGVTSQEAAITVNPPKA